MSAVATSRACANASMDAFDTDCRPGAGWVDTNAATCPVTALIGPNSAPPDLLAFVRTHAVREAASCLGLSRGTVYNLQKGYWPADCRNLLDAWQSYKGRTVKRSTSWFLRRVSAEGVRHGGKFYSSPYLAGREGELIAVARSAEGDLLAVSLELPTERFLLVRV